MGEKAQKICHIMNAVAWTLLVCSLLANYAIWTGKVIRPEWVTDYVSVLSAAEHDGVPQPPAPKEKNPRG